ncbi:unnamed protein product [Durusdinium trenchii]|uniref:P-type H(+)-exporting transporter n=1 Tax=Durusdinium trenchii TaxID=1381693 RepID=A0ABP0NWE8_9DINO
MRPAELHQAALALKSQTTSKIKTNERHCLAVTEVDELTSLVADAETGIARQDLDQALVFEQHFAQFSAWPLTQAVCQELLLKLAASGAGTQIWPLAVIAAQCAKGLPAQAESTLEVHAKELAVDGQRPSSAPYGALVQAYAKQGDLEKVQEHLSAMKSLGLSIDMPSYAAAIEAWAKRGGCDAARRILDEAVASGLHPSRGTFTAAVSAYTKEIGQRVDGSDHDSHARRQRRSLADTWAWLLVASTSSTSRTRRKNSFTSPEAIFKQMLASGVAPNAFVLRALGRAVGLERREELCKEFHLDLSGVPNRRVRSACPWMGGHGCMAEDWEKASEPVSREVALRSAGGPRPVTGVAGVAAGTSPARRPNTSPATCAFPEKHSPVINVPRTVAIRSRCLMQRTPGGPVRVPLPKELVPVLCRMEHDNNGEASTARSRCLHTTHFVGEKSQQVPVELVSAQPLPKRPVTSRIGSLAHVAEKEASRQELPMLTPELRADLKQKLDSLVSVCRTDFKAHPRSTRFFLRELWDLCQLLKVPVSNRPYRRKLAGALSQFVLHIPNFLPADLAPSSAELSEDSFLTMTVMLALGAIPWEFKFNRAHYRLCNCASLGSQRCLVPTGGIRSSEFMTSRTRGRAGEGDGPAPAALRELFHRQEKHLPNRLVDVSAALRVRFVEFVEQVPPVLPARGDEPPELVRGPFTGGDGRPSEPERIQIMIQAAPPPPENLAPTTLSQSLLHSMADAPLGGSNEGPLAGLSSEEAQRRLAQYGRNEIPEHVEPWYVMLGKQFVGMMPGMLIIAAILSGISRDWTDFAVITLMLIVNALIGFHEEFKARQSLDALKAQMTATVPVKRDGSMMIVPVAELVSGDVIFLRGGNIVPADCEFLEGDEMLVDTAALTGEPLPRKVPRPDRPDEPQGAGKMLLSGCIVKQGEAHCEVKETGLNTEIGQAAGLVAEASGHQASMFESKIMQVVHAVILLSLVDAGVVLYVDVGHRGVRFSHALLNVLALVIGAVPIALPLVMQVTMAIGAASMAKRQAIVTHLTALQEIASMTVLCSDKTGTLTTADMRVLPHRTWTCNRTTKDEALLYACLASNPANKEDPIDKAILGSGHEHFGEEEADKLMAMYKKGKFVGFNPTVKRTVVYCEHEEKGKFKISKGLVNKVLITGDDGGDCWECVDADKLKEELNEVDIRFSSQGYKTVGLAVSHNEGPMQFAAIIPMLDPPRGDTKLTIHRIREAGINVKMITGDHLNIAIETSRLIGLGTHVLPASELWPASATRDETIVTADGFAQVLPKDKREVILVLQNRGLVVGMTGDGVNDAPALAQAQIGIAVDGATEAARSAADIILTQPGLSAIFDAVVESRKIFARLRSYVLYRIGATIQIVLVLSILIYAYNDTMPAIYVILLALVNDVTMLPVASDNASPSALPEIPSMPQILLASFLYGFIGTGQTMALYLSDVLHSDPSMDPEERRQYRMAVTYLQMSIAVELNIFSCRTPLYVANLLRPETWPSLLLFICVMGGNLLVSLLAGFGDTFHVVHKVEWVDIVWIWVYDIGCLLVIDFLKRFLNVIGADWMSAGAVGDVLGYPNLPDEFHGASHRSTLLHSRASARSVLHHQSRLSTISQGGGLAVPGKVSGSTLPFPHNLRAHALRHMHSF